MVWETFLVPQLRRLHAPVCSCVGCVQLHFLQRSNMDCDSCWEFSWTCWICYNVLLLVHICMIGDLCLQISCSLLGQVLKINAPCRLKTSFELRAQNITIRRRVVCARCLFTLVFCASTSQTRSRGLGTSRRLIVTAWQNRWRIHLLCPRSWRTLAQ